LHKWLATGGTERRLSSLTSDDLRKEDCRIILLTLIAAQHAQRPGISSTSPPRLGT